MYVYEKSTLPIYNWDVVALDFETNPYTAGEHIQQHNGGRELAIDQSALDSSAPEVLYWKAPVEVLGNFVTLYDGNIEIHFTNDGNDHSAPSDDDFILLRGNGIDLVHRIPSTKRFKANTNDLYSVEVNEVRLFRF